MNNETAIMDAIRLALCKLSEVRIFRNNVGMAWAGNGIRQPHSSDVLVKNARPLHAGLADGSSDLIGWKSITVTPDMVGQTLAVFVSVEVKTPKGRTDAERLQKQTNWIEAVRRAGGIAGFASSVEDAQKIVNGDAGGYLKDQ